MNIKFFPVSVLLLLSTSVLAQASGGPFSIVLIRQLESQTYIQVDSTSLCGTNMFWIENTLAGAKQIAAVALTALATGKSVNLEVRSDLGCTGWGSRLQGVQILR
jgi:hypothetical protein